MMKKRLTNKLLLTYFLVVILPICVVYGFFVVVLLTRTFQSETEKYRYELDMAVNDLETELKKLENIADSILQNGYIKEFLRYQYNTDWEPMYDYMSNVQHQIHSYINYNQNIDTIKFYSDNMRLNPGGYFLNFDMLPVVKTKIYNGFWILDDENKLHYFLGKLDETYKNIDYAVEVITESEVIINFQKILKLNDKTEVCLIDKEEQILYGKLPVEIKKEEMSTYTGFGFIRSGKYCFIKADIKTLNMIVVLYADSVDMAYESLLLLLFDGALLFLVLFILLIAYLQYSLRFAKRLVSFTSYIRSMPDEEYEPYSSDEGEDEIGELVSVFNALVLRTNNLVNMVQKKEILRRKAELDAYQSKIEPHFLYGTLESLRMLALNKDDMEVSDGILDLAKLMRYSLTSSQISTLRSELNQVRRYLNLQKIRLADRLNWEIVVQDEDLLNQQCPQFLLQPIVENSINHGIEKVRRGGSIVISVWKEGDIIVISVADSGAGIDQEQMNMIRKLLKESSSMNNLMQKENEDKGYALYNICMRMKLYYGKDSTLELKNNDPVGTVCTLRLSAMINEIIQD